MAYKRRIKRSYPLHSVPLPPPPLLAGENPAHCPWPLEEAAAPLDTEQERKVSWRQQFDKDYLCVFEALKNKKTQISTMTFIQSLEIRQTLQLL